MTADWLANLIRYSAPVGLASLGECIGQRAGVLNIGLEGMMVVSAYFGVTVSQSTGSAALGVAAGVLAALVVAVLQGWLTLTCRCDQVVAGTATNLLGLGLTGILYRARYGQTGQLLSVPKVAQFGPGWDVIDLSWITLAVLSAWILSKTQWGLALRATGEYPPAVRAAGYQPSRLRWQGALVSGFFAGLAGAYLSLGIAGSFAENMSAGRGFVALAIVTFGRWNPLGTLFASLLIGYADSLQFELQAKGTGLPPQLFIALPYIVSLAVLVLSSKGSTSPAALGQNEE
ncbi:MAG: ABC transporter permease [Chthonomonadaceae bacterium]|nr:ABC transporter permease [Chthonomonadaceae bacterium]